MSAAKERGPPARLQTPATSHLLEERFSEVYEPSEDSFLFMDALQLEAETLRLLQPNTVLEMGLVSSACGSGCVSSFLASLLMLRRAAGASPPVFCAVDKQEAAVEATRATLQLNNPGVFFELLLSDLFRAFGGRGVGLPAEAATGTADNEAITVRKSGDKRGAWRLQTIRSKSPFDLICFNPVRRSTRGGRRGRSSRSTRGPYVPGSPRAAVASEDLPWWGGVLGRQVIDRFVEEVLDFLSPHGILYLVRREAEKLLKTDSKAAGPIPVIGGEQHTAHTLKEQKCLCLWLPLLAVVGTPQQTARSGECPGGPRMHCASRIFKEDTRRGSLHLAFLARRLSGKLRGDQWSKELSKLNAFDSQRVETVAFLQSDTDRLPSTVRT
ncbi:hypothetical protein Efla_001468 [Eimeria flavescens]